MTFLKSIIPQKIACGAQFSLKTLLLSLICYLKSIIINKLKSQQQNTFARLQNNQKEQLISYASFSSVPVPEGTPYWNFPVYGGWKILWISRKPAYLAISPVPNEITRAAKFFGDLPSDLMNSLRKMVFLMYIIPKIFRLRRAMKNSLLKKSL